MTVSLKERFLLIVGPGRENSPRVAEALAGADPAVTTILSDARGRANLEKYAVGEYLDFAAYPSPWALLGALRGRCFQRVVLVADGFDLRLALTAWAAGAPRCRFVPAGEGREKEIRIQHLVVPLLGRFLVAAALSLPVWLMRLLFLFEKYLRPVPPPPPEYSPFPPNHPVSVVIPNYNGQDLLAECLPSVEQAVAAYGHGSELIVVDDASSDGSLDLLRRQFPAVKTIALKRNLGFGAAADRGIRAAASDQVLLLNSDISAEPGFIAPLAAELADASVFAVQPRADAPAGGLNFGLNVGRIERGYPRIWNEADVPGDPPRLDEVSPTLYALGGAMLFDRRKYLRLGGFDSLYHPFRWEDIDLCYRALKRGWRVVYQPASRVVHKHHATLDRVFSDRVRNVVETRNELLFAWKNLTESNLLDEHLARLPGHILGHLLAGRTNFARALAGALLRLGPVVARRRRELRESVRLDRRVFNRPLRRYRRFRRGAAPGRRRILVVNPVLPCPPVDGGKQRVFHVLKALAERNEVHLLCFSEPSQRGQEEVMAEFCASVTTVEVPADYGWLGWLGEALFPMYYRHFYSPDFVRALRKLLDRVAVDVIQVEFDKMLYYGDLLESYPSVYIEHDVASLYLHGGKNPPHRGLKRLIDVLEWLRAVRWEVVQGRKFWKLVALSPEDERVLRRLLPGADIASVKHGTSVEQFLAPYREVEEKSLVYVGSFGHYPNVEAVLYFCREVWPRIKAEEPEATLTVVGSRPPEEVEALGRRPGIEVTGFVESVLPYLDRAAVFVAPMRKGFGMKGKILEAMARAKPVVTTPIGVRGAAVIPGRHLMVGRTPDELAAAVLRLFRDTAFRRAVAEAGQELVVEEYDWGCSAVQLEEIYAQLLEEE